MTTTTVTDIQSKREELSLDAVLKDFEHWRATKPNSSVPIPEELWKKIFRLSEQHSPATLRRLLGITSRQYNQKHNQLCADLNKPTLEAAQIPTVELCEVKVVSKETPKVVPKPAYKPLDVPATTTIIAEFCRPDGQIMKIHTTTNRFEELLQAFFKGNTDDTSHTET